MTNATNELTQADEITGEGYARSCPICDDVWPSSKMAIKCWYLHDPEFLSQKPLADIAIVLGISTYTARRAWQYLVQKYEAPIRHGGGEGEPGDSYDRVVQFIRDRRSKRKGLGRGWTVKLSDETGVSRQRVSQLAQRAAERGDL